MRCRSSLQEERLNLFNTSLKGSCFLPSLEAVKMQGNATTPRYPSYFY
jgi:hypothetical protein